MATGNVYSFREKLQRLRLAQRKLGDIYSLTNRAYMIEKQLRWEKASGAERLAQFGLSIAPFVAGDLGDLGEMLAELDTELTALRNGWYYEYDVSPVEFNNIHSVTIEQYDGGVKGFLTKITCSPGGSMFEGISAAGFDDWKVVLSGCDDPDNDGEYLLEPTSAPETRNGQVIYLATPPLGTDTTGNMNMRFRFSGWDI